MIELHRGLDLNSNSTPVAAVTRSSLTWIGLDDSGCIFLHRLQQGCLLQLGAQCYILGWLLRDFGQLFCLFPSSPKAIVFN